jgi:hypothetical protein
MMEYDGKQWHTMVYDGVPGGRRIESLTNDEFFGTENFNLYKLRFQTVRLTKITSYGEMYQKILTLRWYIVVSTDSSFE